MNREELQREIGKSKRLRDMSQQNIAFWNTRLAELELQLAKIDRMTKEQEEKRSKPDSPSKTGDYGFDSGRNAPYILMGDDIFWLSGELVRREFDSSDFDGCCGNLVDDIKAMREDRTEYHIKTRDFDVVLDDDDDDETPICIGLYGNEIWFTAAIAREFAHALLQIAATAERRAAE